MARFRNNDQQLIVEPVYRNNGLQIERVQRFDGTVILPESAQWKTWSMRITLSGTRYINHQERAYTLGPNTICLCAPLTQPVRVRSLPGTGSDVVNLHWSVTGWQQFLKTYGAFHTRNTDVLNESGLLCLHEAPPQVLFVLRRLLALGNATRPPQLAIDNYGTLLVSLLAELQFSTRSRPTDTTQRQRVEQAQTSMVRDLAAPLRVDELARTLHVSPRQLQRDFLAQTGMTPVRYFNMVRLSEANFLLAETVLPVATIAEMLGYVSLTHFSTAFRQIYSYSPREVRRTVDEGIRDVQGERL